MDRLNWLGWIGVLGAIATVGVASPAQAENPDHVRQLVRTGDCPGCDLSDTVLSGLNLHGANLQDADLGGTQFQNVQLNRANLSGANLSGANFVGTGMQGANLQAASLVDASSFFFCSVFSANGSEVSANEISDCVAGLLFRQLGPQLCDDSYGLAEELGDFIGLCAEDPEALFLASIGAFYGGGNLTGLNLIGADLTGADLTGADLSGSDLRYASLGSAIATEANFSYALMFDAVTTDLQNADLSTAWQTPADIGQWLNATLVAAQQDAARSEGRTYVGAMGRAQQAHYLEFSKFSTELEPLAIGIESETESYRYGIISLDPTLMAVQYALSQQADLNSYVTVVFLEPLESGEEVSVSVLCESPDVGVLQIADIPTPDASNQGCPASWTVL
ncbi:MAG: pentapeptide repeat-containing protein [Cyanobacteria bacterium J06648_16]